MPFLDVMQTYFRGEKVEALVFILPIGLLLLICGGLALRFERTDFTWGAAIPAIFFGLILTATGIGVGGRTSGQVEELRRGFEQSPATMVEEELPRMLRVERNFRMTLVAFGVSAAIGLILVFLVGSGWAQGLGSALILAGGLGLVIDGVAMRRAEPYTAMLGELAEQHEVRIEVSDS